MTPRVRLQVGQLRERLVAPRMTAFVRLVTGMGPDVLLQVRQLRELALTDLTSVGFDAQVDPSVLRQIRRVGERLRTLRALIWLGLTHVDLSVQLHVCLRAKDLDRAGHRISQTVKQ